MASTTLNTFFFPAPDFPVRTVEMKGSWDLFEKSYPLKKDSQTGSWRCCHAFENIVCDGVTFESSASRDGGLKMGGTYWYYYILRTIDGDLETFSDGEPNTRSCPLLPGQTMNVLEVPIQADLVAGRNVSSTSIDSLVFTLDPKDKYLAPGARRAASTSAIKQQKASMSAAPKIVHRAASTPLQSESPPKTSTSARAGQPTLERQRSLMSVFQRLRQTRSAGSNAKSNLAWPLRVLSRTGQSTKTGAVEDIPEVPKLPTHVSGAFIAAEDMQIVSPDQTSPAAHNADTGSLAAGVCEGESVNVPWPLGSSSTGEHQPDFACVHSSHRRGRSIEANSDFSFEPRQSTPLEDSESCFAEFSAVIGDNVGLGTPRPPTPGTQTVPKLPVSESVAQQRSARALDYEPQSAEEQQEAENRLYAINYGYSEASRLSYATCDEMSPDLDSNTTHSGPISPLHLSQPETPTTSEFEEDYDADFLQLRRCSKSSIPLSLDDSIIHSTEVYAPRPPSRAPPPPPQKAGPRTPRSTLSGFQGYSLQQDEYKSVLTIRRLPSTTFTTSDAKPPFPQKSGKQDMVRSWNDGSEQLLEDLGYLGELIH